MKTILFLLLILSTYISHAQLSGQARIDSLEAELPKANADTNKVILLSDLAFGYHTINSEKGLEYGEEALALAEDIDWKEGVALGYHYIGVSHFAKYDFPKTLEYYGKALRTYEELGDSLGVAASLTNMGLVYRNQSDYPKALEYYGKALKVYEELGDKAGIAASLSNMGIIYHTHSDYPKALEYHEEALKINEELDDRSGVARNLGNIGIVYIYQSNYSKGLEYWYKGLAIFQELGDRQSTAASLGNIGGVHAIQSNYPKALELFGEARMVCEELGDKGGVAANLGNMGNLYLDLYREGVNINPNELNEYTSLNKEVNLNNAISYTLEAIKIGEEIGELETRIQQLYNLADAYKLKREPWKALETIEEHHKLKDSVFNTDKSKEIGKLEAEREQIEKENQLKEDARIADELASQRNRLQYLGIGAFVVFLAVLLLLSGRMKLSESIARALVFLSFIFLFEFILVMVDPWTDEYSEGIPMIKFAINMGLALIIFPMHQYFEKRVSAKVLGSDHPPKE